jgi:hypothetical protein
VVVNATTKFTPGMTHTHTHMPPRQKAAKLQSLQPTTISDAGASALAIVCGVARDKLNAEVSNFSTRLKTTQNVAAQQTMSAPTNGPNERRVRTWGDKKSPSPRQFASSVWRDSTKECGSLVDSAVLRLPLVSREVRDLTATEGVGGTFRSAALLSFASHLERRQQHGASKSPWKCPFDAFLAALVRRWTRWARHNPHEACTWLADGHVMSGSAVTNLTVTNRAFEALTSTTVAKTDRSGLPLEWVKVLPPSVLQWIISIKHSMVERTVCYHRPVFVPRRLDSEAGRCRHIGCTSPCIPCPIQTVTMRTNEERRRVDECLLRLLTVDHRSSLDKELPHNCFLFDALSPHGPEIHASGCCTCFCSHECRMATRREVSQAFGCKDCDEEIASGLGGAPLSLVIHHLPKQPQCVSSSEDTDGIVRAESMLSRCLEHNSVLCRRFRATLNGDRVWYIRSDTPWKSLCDTDVARLWRMAVCVLNVQVGSLVAWIAYKRRDHAILGIGHKPLVTLHEPFCTWRTRWRRVAMTHETNGPCEPIRSVRTNVCTFVQACMQ